MTDVPEQHDTAAAPPAGEVSGKRNGLRRKRPRRDPPTWSARLYLRIAPMHMALARFLLEGNDHLGYLSVLDRTTGLMIFIHSPDQTREALDFIEQARTVLPIEVVETPGRKEGA